MKKRLLALMMSAVMVCSLAACSGAPAASSQTSAGSEAAAEGGSGSGELTGTLKVGMIGPLTGAAALYGSAVNNGTKIAVDEINALGGSFKMEYQPEDDEHDAEKSVNAYNKLKDWDVQAIVGCVTTTPCVAVAAEANSDRVFMLTPSASATSVTEQGDDIFQLCFSDPNQGSASAQYIKDNNIGSKIAIIYNNSDVYSTGIYQTFSAKAAEVGLEVVSTTTFTDDTANDFSVQLTDAKDNGADLIFLPIYYTPASLILQQADKMGYKVPMFGVDGMDGILGLEGFDTKLAEGVMLLTPFSADAKDEKTVNFVTKYQESFKEVPIQFAADGYDCPYAIYEALKFYAEKNGGLDVTGKSYADICEILVSVFSDPSFSVDGITGEGMTWTPQGEVNKAPKAVVIKDGAYVGL
ncbi:MAG: ABC transporter substrate-binding protein [Lachnospiraceae bacterium]|nr:ABC transporter substrate-binding protein [Lachnospiraceae bacterium]